MCCLVPPEFIGYGIAGVPVPSVEIKLCVASVLPRMVVIKTDLDSVYSPRSVDVEEAGYFSSNTPPQGEVYVRGPSVAKGYCARFSFPLGPMMLF